MTSDWPHEEEVISAWFDAPVEPAPRPETVEEVFWGTSDLSDMGIMGLENSRETYIWLIENSPGPLQNLFGLLAQYNAEIAKRTYLKMERLRGS